MGVCKAKPAQVQSVIEDEGRDREQYKPNLCCIAVFFGAWIQDAVMLY